MLDVNTLMGVTIVALLFVPVGVGIYWLARKRANNL